MNKVLLIGAAPLSESPYYISYIEILNQNKIPYDLLFWNKHLDNTDELPENHIPYNLFADNKFPKWKRLHNNWKFARFASKWLKKNDYTYVVAFTISHAIFMSRILCKKYRLRYIFDIRDYSRLLEVSFFRKTVDILVKNSAIIVVSSAGFLRWLPKDKDCRYVVAHNTTKKMVSKYLNCQCKNNPLLSNSVISVLTIGQLRNFEANSCIIRSLCKSPHFQLVYAGCGPASNQLLKFVEENNINNVIFTGRYEKSDEESIVLNNQMINMYLGQDINSKTLMTNRFYLSVQMRKPMIASKGSFQGDLCEEYGLGVVIDKDDDIAEKILKWWNFFDANKYNEACQAFLKKVELDMDIFGKELVDLFYKM